MLRFASAFLLACATASQQCDDDSKCKKGKRCNLDEGVCEKPLDALVVTLVGSTDPTVDDKGFPVGVSYPPGDIEGTIYLT